MSGRRLPSQHTSTTPVTALSASVGRYARKPYGERGEIAHQYHLNAYLDWCRSRSLEAFPLNFEQLLRFGVDRAQSYAYFTVREDIRIVAMEHRKATGIDLYCDTRIDHFLKSLKRMRPPKPVLPLSASEFECIVACKGETWKTRRSRVMALLVWSAGFTISELHHLDAEMIAFGGNGATITFPAHPDLRKSIFVGRASVPHRCPVAALEELLTERSILSGPVFHKTPRRKPHIRFRLSYDGVTSAIELLAKQAGFQGRLSVERIRRGGIVAQSQYVDIVTLAHYHGLKSVDALAAYLSVRTQRPAKFTAMRYRKARS